MSAKGRPSWYDPAGVFHPYDQPRPPDPNETAAAQTESNVQTAIANSQLGNVNQITPYGNITYSQQAGVNGVPQWTQTTTESPNQQALRQLQEQQGIALGELGLGQTGRVSDILSQPYDPRRFDTNSVTGGPLDVNQALGGDFNSDMEARTRMLMSRGLDEQFGRADERLRTRLANQGISAGSDAFGHETRNFQEGQGNAYMNAELAARQMALGERGQHLGEVLTERGTNLGEALQQYGLDTQADQAARSNPLNEIIALASGVQTTPITPGLPNQGQINGTNIADIINQGYANQMGAWNAQQQTASANTGAAAGLAGSALIVM